MIATFSKRVKEAGLPPKFRMPSEKYSGTEDPVSHLESFVHQMEVQSVTRIAMCRMFPSTLIDCAKTWFRKLPPGSVDSFSKLTKALCTVLRDQAPSQGSYLTTIRG